MNLIILIYSLSYKNKSHRLALSKITYTLRTAPSLHLSMASLAQWRRQHSKRVGSFRGQKILEPGHLDALFSLKLTTFFIVVALKIKTQAANTVEILSLSK